MHSLKSTIVIDSPQRHVAPTSRLLFMSIMDECDYYDVMTYYIYVASFPG